MIEGLVVVSVQNGLLDLLASEAAKNHCPMHFGMKGTCGNATCQECWQKALEERSVKVVENA